MVLFNEMSLIAHFWPDCPESTRTNPTVNGLALALVTADTGARAHLAGREHAGQRVTVTAKTERDMLRGRKAVVDFLRATLPTGFSYDDVNGRRTWQDKDGNWVTSMYW